MARDIKDVSTDELLADLPQVSGAVRKRIEDELASRGATPPSASAQNPTPAPAPAPASPEMSLGGFMGNIGPSAMNTGTDMLKGIGNLVTSPIDTVAGMPAGMADHYGSRYNSPEQAAQTAYNDPVGALMDVPVLGTGMRLLGAAGKVGGAGRLAETAGTVGRGLEKLDPFGAAVGGAQMGIGALANRIATPAESMAGSYYGQPRGRQVDNFDEYLGTVDAAIEQGIPATTAGARMAEEAKQASGSRLNEALEGTGKLDAVELFQQLNAKLDELGDLEVSAPARSKLDEFKRDLIRLSDEQGYISAADLNSLKSKYDKTINFDNVTTGAELSSQQGALAGSNVARGALRESVGPEFADYSARVGIEDVARRGAQQDLMRKGSGITGDIFAQGLNAIAPVLTGQGRLKRMQGRQAVEQGRLLDAANHALDVTLYGRVRQGAYLGEMSDGNEQWHVGRLWNEE